MERIIINPKKEGFVHVAEVEKIIEDDGIISVYSDNKYVGSVIFDNEEWWHIRTMNTSDTHTSLSSLMNENSQYTFKFII